MLDPLESENLRYFNALAKKRKRAFFVLTIENAMLHLWQLFFWFLMFSGLWMLGIPEFLGSYISILTAIIFAIGILYFFKRDLLSFKFPTVENIDRALEKQSSFAKGFISILDDDLANPQKHKTRDLWHYAQKEVLFSIKSLKVPHIKVVLSREDPSAIRFFAVLIFVSGLMVSGEQWQSKILSGMLPFSSSGIITQERTTNLWISPPQYTQIGQIHITGNTNPNGKILTIPEGSKIRVRIYSRLGKFFPPTMHIGKTSLPLTYLGDRLYGVEATIESGESIYIKQALITRAQWGYNFIKDKPPEILAKQPAYKVLEDSQIRFSLIVKDDYGVKNLNMRMKIDEMVEDHLPLGKAVEQTRLVMSRPDSEFRISPVYDFTWHTWAGLPVTFEYSVTDHKGQSTALGEISLILPEREFKHPMAKKLIAIRKRLAWDYDDNFLDISRNIETLSSVPDYSQNNLTLYLALRSASSRLFYAESFQGEKRIKSVKEVINLLWNIALVIEDGNLSLAMRELQEAQRNLENALSDPNITDKEIDALMDKLREKMVNYFAQMQREMQKNVGKNDLSGFSIEDFGQIISPDALSTLMQQIESALKSGDTQKAQELVSQLQRMLEMMALSKKDALPSDIQAMYKGINELQELIKNQQKLLEQTMTGNPPSRSEQEALRYILGQIMIDVSEKIDNIPEKMGLAEQEMRYSAHALGEGNPQYSILPQKRAIKYLKDSQENLNNQFKRRMKQMVGIGFSGVRQSLDPLGRPYEENPSSDVQLPDEVQKKRVDEILKILRDRSGDRSRPVDELDYFRRLLRQF